MRHCSQIVADLALHGTSLVVDGDRVRFFFSAAPPDSLLEEARAQRDALRTLLTRPVNTYTKAMAALRTRCPAYIDEVRWRQFVADADFFLGRWGMAAEELGWTAEKLFGLHKPPDNPRPNYAAYPATAPASSGCCKAALSLR